MRIERIEVIPIQIPLPRSFSGSKYQVTSRCTIVTRLYVEGGLVSEVYNGDNRRQGREIVRIIEEELAPQILGEDIFAWERIWSKLFHASHDYGKDRAVAMEAIACVDTAVWDVIGKALNVSVCKLFGGFRDRLPIVAIAGYYEEGKTLADLAKEMDWLRSVGMAGCKVKVGGLSAEEDAERVRAARDGGGPDFIIGVDANRGWDFREAIRFARLVEPYDIRWFEEPCHWQDDARGMAEVRRATSIPINARQSEISSHGVRRLVEAGAVDLINFDASHGGGVSEWRRAAALCDVDGIRMAHHEETQIAVHLLAGVPHGTFVECFANPDRDPIWAGMISNRAPLADGWLDVPTGPGFGLELDWDGVEVPVAVDRGGPPVVMVLRTARRPCCSSPSALSIS